jgi:hypothetical protein
MISLEKKQQQYFCKWKIYSSKATQPKKKKTTINIKEYCYYYDQLN